MFSESEFPKKSILINPIPINTKEKRKTIQKIIIVNRDQVFF
jgi:hypothetical protein